MELEPFFQSIGLDCWIEPLTDLGVTSLKFLYLNFDDVLEEERLKTARANRLHVKIILKRLKALFAEQQQQPPSAVKEEPRSPAEFKETVSQPNSIASLSDFLDFGALNDPLQIRLTPGVNGWQSLQEKTPQEKLTPMLVARPEDPVKSRFLEDWDVYGQIQFFDTATYQPDVPASISHYAQDQPNHNRKDYEAARELLCQNIFQDLCRYFIWRMPTRFLHTALDRFIQHYPWWDDGSPTKTEIIKKRVLDKYTLLRRYKQPPDWIKHKYNSQSASDAGDGTPPVKRAKRIIADQETLDQPMVPTEELKN